jgi:hypothetical protein
MLVSGFVNELLLVIRDPVTPRERDPFSAIRSERLLSDPLAFDVMDQERSDDGINVEVVVVVARDGEVPHPAISAGGSAPADHGPTRSARAGGAEVVSVPQRPGLDPLVLRHVPEQVIAGRVDDRGTVPCSDGRTVTS